MYKQNTNTRRVKVCTTKEINGVENILKGVKIEEKWEDMNVDNLMYFWLANSNNLMKIENILWKDPIGGVKIISEV